VQASPSQAFTWLLIRAAATLGLFALAAVIALKYPIPGLAICCGCLILYLKPGALEITA
jgi:hypothetical protein